MPDFVLGFITLAAANTAGLIPPALSSWLADISRWALLVAIAAVGMKTALRRILNVGGQAITLIVAETVFIAAFVMIGIRYLA